MDEKLSSKILLAALRNKFPKAAILPEVTMEDEIEAHRQRSASILSWPRYKNIYDRKGLSYDVDIELPESYNYKTVTLIRRIDALIFEGKNTTAVEIKISRSDFFRDTLEKRSPWMRHTNRFVYLTPKGLVKLEEVPENCGLWEYENGSIVSVKNATRNKALVDFPTSMIRYFAWRAFIAEQKSGRY